MQNVDGINLNEVNIYHFVQKIQNPIIKQLVLR